MLTFESFYRKTGIRFQEKIGTPTLTNVDSYELPLNSQFNYVGDGTSVGPVLSQFPFDRVNRIMQCQHTFEYVEPQGTVRMVQDYITFMPVIKNYHRQNPEILLNTAGLDKVGSPNVLTVRSFAGLSLRYRYQNNEFTAYNRWRNKWFTVFTQLNKDAANSDRNQFIVIDISKSVQSKDVLDMQGKNYHFFKEKKPRQDTLRKFNTDESLMFFQFWLWLGPERERSMLALLDPKYYGRINIIFKSNGYLTTVNLGLLDSFRKDPTDEDSVGLPTEVIQKRFRAMYIRLSNIEEHFIDEVDDVVASDTVAAAKKDKSKIVVVVKKDAKGTIQRLVEEPSEPVYKEDESEVKTKDQTPTLADDVTDKDIDDFLQEYDYGVGVIGEFDDNTITDEVGNVEEEQTDSSTNVADLLVPPRPPVLPPVKPEDGIIQEVKRLVAGKSLTAGEIRRYQDLSVKYKTMKVPEPVRVSMGKDDATVEEAINVDIKELSVKPRKLKPIQGVLDENMLTTTVEEVAPTYIQKLLHRNVVATIMSMQNSAFAVSDIKVEEVTSAVTEYYKYSFKTHPVGGRESTETFKIPKVNENGEMLIGGVKYFLKNQRTDLPIRKVGPRRVAITTHYGKLFIDRLDLQATNYTSWLRNKITAIGIDSSNPAISDLRTGNVYDKTLKAPRTYSAIGLHFQTMTVRPVKQPTMELKLVLNHQQMDGFMNAVARSLLTADNAIPVGWDKTKNVLGMLPDGVIRLYRAVGGPVDLGTFEDLIGADISKAPVEFAVVKVFGRPMPLGLVLGYHLGLNNVIKMFGVTPRIVPADKPVRRSVNEYVIKFADYALVFDRRDTMASLIYGGIRSAAIHLTDFKFTSMNDPETYHAIFDRMGLPVYAVKELDIIYTRLVDPISKTILEQMGEPTDAIGLYLRAAELLDKDYHPEEVSGKLTLIRGYERFNETIYKELTSAIRQRGKTVINNNRTNLSLNPEAIWQQILQDSAKEIVNEINPIQNLKQKEIVTYGGAGGRSKDTMVKRTRVMAEDDKGLISEAGVDSGSVGIISFMPPNPTLANLYGMTDIKEPGELNITNMFSTSALNAPAAENDSINRIGFISIQQQHTIGVKGAKVAPYRTGYEQVIPHRTDDLYAYCAKKPGKVTSNDGKVIVIEYEDGSVKTIQLGIRYGRSAGALYPHDVVSDLKTGDVFDEGAVISYNKNFFVKDWINPKGVALASGVMANIAIKDVLETYEDGSVINKRIAELMEAPFAAVRPLVIGFNEVPYNLVKEGDLVEYETILCTIGAPVVAGEYNLDPSVVEGLRSLSRDNPKAQTYGVVQKLEFLYNGELENMNEELRKIAVKFDKELRNTNLALGKTAVTGRTESDYRIAGKPLLKNHAVLMVYMTSTLSMGIGDKLVLANQMKATVSRVIEGVNETVTGTLVDGMFAYRGINSRIVNSLKKMGTSNRLMQHGTGMFVKIARGEMEPPTGLRPPKK